MIGAEIKPRTRERDMTIAAVTPAGNSGLRGPPLKLLVAALLTTCAGSFILVSSADAQGGTTARTVAGPASTTSWSSAVDARVTGAVKLAGTEQIGQAFFGGSVALSAGGNTALVGGGGDNGSIGAAWVLTRSGPTWIQQAKLVPTAADSVDSTGYGFSVALSADGNTALVGGPRATLIFTRVGSVWIQQAEFPGGGVSVALSADGNTALISNDLAETVTVFSRSGSTWAQQAKLTVSEKSGGAQFGRAVALSADGNTALIGAPDNNHLGAAWIFIREGSTWTQQGPKITGRGMSGRFVNFGFSVALSGDGGTALIGGPGDHTGVGAAWIFTRSGQTWKQRGAKLTGGGETGSSEFGSSVALSFNGRTALVGGWGDNGSKGATWVFTRSGVRWVQQGSKFTRNEAQSGFGHSVALSSSGKIALVGSTTEENAAIGTAWAFAIPSHSATRTTTRR